MRHSLILLLAFTFAANLASACNSYVTYTVSYKNGRQEQVPIVNYADLCYNQLCSADK